MKGLKSWWSKSYFDKKYFLFCLDSFSSECWPPPLKSATPELNWLFICTPEMNESNQIRIWSWSLCVCFFWEIKNESIILVERRYVLGLKKGWETLGCVYIANATYSLSQYVRWSLGWPYFWHPKSIFTFKTATLVPFDTWVLLLLGGLRKINSSVEVLSCTERRHDMHSGFTLFWVNMWMWAVAASAQRLDVQLSLQGCFAPTKRGQWL